MAGMDEKELAEFEAYMRAEESGSGPHKPEIALLAGIGLLLLELIRRTPVPEKPQPKK